MRLDAVLALVVALAVGGCATSEFLPAQTGSLHPTINAKGSTDGTSEPNAALLDAISTCLNRTVPVKTPEFQRCVQVARRSTLAPTGLVRDRKWAEAGDRREGLPRP